MPRYKTYVVSLTDAERKQLTSITQNYRLGPLERRRAQILLLTDQGFTDAEVAKKAGCSSMTVRNVRFRYVQAAASEAEPVPLRQQIRRAPQKNRAKRAFDGEREAKLVALTCSAPPEGSARWTLQLLKERVIELGIVEGVAKETIRRTLKKTNSGTLWVRG